MYKPLLHRQERPSTLKQLEITKTRIHTRVLRTMHVRNKLAHQLTGRRVPKPNPSVAAARHKIRRRWAVDSCTIGEERQARDGKTKFILQSIVSPIVYLHRR